MKRMMQLANPDVLNPGATDGGVNQTPDEQAFASQAGGLLHQVPERPSALRQHLAGPEPSCGFGGPAEARGRRRRHRLLDTGAVLFKYGENKEQAAQYHGQADPTTSGSGRTRSTAICRRQPAVGQLPVYASVWDEYEANRPEWMTDWAFAIKDGLGAAQAIAPTILAIQQFDIAAPFYLAYLPGEESDAKTALTKAMDAVQAAVRGRDVRSRDLPERTACQAVPPHSRLKCRSTLRLEPERGSDLAQRLEEVLMAQLYCRPAARRVDPRSNARLTRVGDRLSRYRRCPGSSCCPTISLLRRLGASIRSSECAWFSFLDYRPIRRPGRSPSSGCRTTSRLLPIRSCCRDSSARRNSPRCSCPA